MPRQHHTCTRQAPLGLPSACRQAQYDDQHVMQNCSICRLIVVSKAANCIHQRQIKQERKGVRQEGTGKRFKEQKGGVKGVHAGWG